MIHFAVIGTNWITEKFIAATRIDNKLSLCAVYSRTLESAQAFAKKFHVQHCYNNLERLSEDKQIEAVYIASPNSLHFEQTMQMLKAGKHVICEKPLASNNKQVEFLYQTALEHNVILFEAYLTAHLPNFKQIKNNLNALGKLRKANIHFCQLSSRYPAYLAGKNPNTFNPAFSNGSIMDIGYYCIAFTVALFGQPKSIQASAYLLESGVDGCGSVLLSYGEFSVTIDHSKISNSQLKNEIQGEEGSIQIDHIALCEKISLFKQNITEDISVQQNENAMYYETLSLIKQIENKEMDAKAISRSKITSEVITQIRYITGVQFPSDKT